MAGGFDAASTHLSRTPLDLDDDASDQLNGLLRHRVELVMLQFGWTSAP